MPEPYARVGLGCSVTMRRFTIQGDAMDVGRPVPQMVHYYIDARLLVFLILNFKSMYYDGQHTTECVVPMGREKLCA